LRDQLFPKTALKTIRASEIGAFIYCQRAWWYQKSGHKPENQAELVSGQQIHTRHGRAVVTAGCIRALAYGLLLLALVILAVSATLSLL